MKKISLTMASLALLGVAPATAADLPSRKAPPTYFAPQPVAAWTGFYAGVNVGGVFGGDQNVTTSAADLFDAPGFLPGAAFAASAASVAQMSNSGFIGGGQVGYNYQFNPAFVAGLEADIQGVTGSSSTTVTGIGFDALSGATPVTTAQMQKSLDYLGTVRGRLGYLVTPTFLLYATGGLAYGGANLQANFASIDAANVMPPGFAVTNYSDTRVGYTVGAGLEWLFLPNWSAKLEYLYYDLGSASTPGTAAAGVTGAGVLQWAYAPMTTARYDGHIVRAGLNYHFNWGTSAPVLAKF